MHRVLLVGVPRGGTTWVGTMLGSTAGAVYVHEPDGTHDPFAFRSKFDLLHHPMLDPGETAVDYERLWAGAFAGGTPTHSLRDRIARKAYRGVSGDQKVAARQRGRITPRLRIVLAAAEPLGPSAAAPRHVVVKSVNSAFSTEWLADRFSPDVGVISRHPLNVVASWRDFGWTPPQGPMYEAIRSRAATRWSVDLPPADAPAIERAAATIAALAYGLHDSLERHPEWVAISHEELCVDPHVHFPAIAARLGLDWSDAATTELERANRPGEGYAINRVSADQPQRWRERLEPDEIAVVTEVLGRFPATTHWLDAAG